MPIRLAGYAPYDATKALGFYGRLDECRLASHEGVELAAIVASFFPTIAKDIWRVRCSGIIKPGLGEVS